MFGAEGGDANLSLADALLDSQVGDDRLVNMFGKRSPPLGGGVDCSPQVSATIKVPRHENRTPP